MMTSKNIGWLFGVLFVLVGACDDDGGGVCVADCDGDPDSGTVPGATFVLEKQGTCSGVAAWNSSVTVVTTHVPDTYPAEVEELVYALLGIDGVAGPPDTECRQDLPHTAEVWVSDDATTPPAIPNVRWSEVVQLDEDREEVQLVARRLEEPIVLSSGQAVHVALKIQDNGDPNISLCVPGCTGIPEDEADHTMDFNTEPPFLWSRWIRPDVGAVHMQAQVRGRYR